MQRLSFLLAVAVMLCLGLAMRAHGQEARPMTAWVTEPVTYVYDGSPDERVIYSQLIYGATVDVIETVDEWSVIEFRGQRRLITSSALTVPGQAPPVEWRSDVQVAHDTQDGWVGVAALAAHVYDRPSFRETVPRLTLPLGARLPVINDHLIDDDNPWCQVVLLDGSRAWVQVGDVEVGEPSLLSAEASVELARRFMGRPYTWGGASSFGFDCSGLTQALARARGVELAHSAQGQSTTDQLETVSIDELQPGDFLYFGRGGEGGVFHCGVYAGDGRFIHATSRRMPMVQEELLAESRWAERLVRVRRLPASDSADG